MSRTPPRQSRPVAEKDDDAPVDFDAPARLKKLIESRPHESGITIDPAGTRIIDDGLWIRPLASGWVIKSHIADVPAMIPEDNIIERVARDRKNEVEIDSKRREIQRIFPGSFLDRYVSLHEGQARPAITFRIELDKTFSVKRYKISRTAFTSTKQCDYSPLRGQFDLSRDDAQGWKELAWGLHAARLKRLTSEGDRLIDSAAPLPDLRYPAIRLPQKDTETLVHEVMRLTNQVATDFFQQKNVNAPTKNQGVHLDVTSVTLDFDFDQTCNKLCWNVINHLVSQKGSYVRLTSPMRIFRDYVALKVLGRTLANQGVNEQLTSDVSAFSESFNHSSQDRMSSGRWHGSWKQVLDQRQEHPFDSALKCGYPTIAADLNNLCHKNGWRRPMIAQRTMMVQGIYMYFSGMNMPLPAGVGRDRQSWAISRDPEMALEMAAHRMLETLKPLASMQAPKISSP